MKNNLRKIFSIIICFALAVSVFLGIPDQAKAEVGEGTLVYTVGSVTGSLGDVVTVPISITETLEGGIAYGFFVLDYDEEVLTLEGFAPGEYLTEIEGSLYQADVSGYKNRGYQRINGPKVNKYNIPETGEIIKCTFSISSEAKEQEYAISLKPYVLESGERWGGYLDSSGKSVYFGGEKCSVIAGKITIAEQEDPTWNLVDSSEKMQKAIAKANNLTDDSTITLMNDIKVDSGLTVKEGANITIVSESGKTYTLTGNGSQNLFTLGDQSTKTPGGTLTVENVTLDANGATYCIDNYKGTVNLKGGTTVTGAGDGKQDGSATAKRQYAGIYNHTNIYSGDPDTFCNIGSGVRITGNAIGIRNYAMVECNINGGTVSGNTYQGVRNDGILNCNSGSISDNGYHGTGTNYMYETSAGGGIQNSGTLNFKSGFTISNNKCWFGGGIYNSALTETLTIPSGVTISGNEALLGGGIMNAFGTLILDGGTISANKALIDDKFERSGNGAGVFLNGNRSNKPVFTVTSGSITGNQITGSSNKGYAYLQGHGGGIFVNQESVLNLEGGSVSGNAAQNGNGIYVSDTIFSTARTGASADSHTFVNQYGETYFNVQGAPDVKDEIFLAPTTLLEHTLEADKDTQTLTPVAMTVTGALTNTEPLHINKQIADYLSAMEGKTTDNIVAQADILYTLTESDMKKMDIKMGGDDSYWKAVLDTAQNAVVCRQVEVTLSSDSYAFDGTAVEPEPTVTVDGEPLVKDTDYTVSYKNNQAVGKASVVITGSGSYIGKEVEKEFTILEEGAEGPGTDEPGTDEPGTDEPGTDEPGTDKPGTDEPGTDKPGTDEPGTDNPGTDKPGTDKPGTNTPGNEPVIDKNEDGSSTETTVAETKNEQGSNVKTTTVVSKDANGKVTGTKVEAEIQTAGETIKVTVSKDANGGIQSAAAQLGMEGKTSSGKTKATIGADTVKQIVQAAGTDDVDVKYTVRAADGSKVYTVTVNAADMTAGNTLYIVYTTGKGESILVNAKKYKVNSAGNVSISMADTHAYKLVSAEEMDQINNNILKTVKPAKTKANVKKSKTTKMKLSSKLNQQNIKTIKYTSTKTKVAKVNKNGKITGVKKGTAKIKAKVTLKSGAKKTVKMKVTVK